LLTDIERVVDGLHDAGEIDDSVEQLEAILYGGRGGDGDGDGDNDDGFDWTTSSSPLKNDHRSSVQPSFDRSERKDASYDGDGWDGLPSHRTNGRHYPMNPRGNKSGDGSDSEASAWTQDYNGDDGSSSGGRDSFHNSEAYAKRGSLELVSTGGNDRPPRRRYGKLPPPPPSSATYKYRISLYIQMQLCHPTTLADYISHRNGNCVDFDEDERRERSRLAIEIFGQIVSGLSHVQ
jgi:hypothetical protein